METIVYVETIPANAYVMIQNLAKISTAKRIIGDLEAVDYPDIMPAAQALEDLERAVRLKVRSELLETAAKPVPDQLIERIKSKIKTQLIGEKIV